MKCSRCSAAFASLFCGILLVGCNSAGPNPLEEINTVPVEGTVTLDGSPASGVELTFTPDVADFQKRGATPMSAIGRTDDAGHFEMQITDGSFSKLGAAPGKYQVRLAQPLNQNGAPYDPKDKTQRIEQEGLPLKYMDVSKPALDADVPEEGGTIDFELTSG